MASNVSSPVVTSQRRCLGREGKPCSQFMADEAKDQHLLCPKCRGQTCRRDATCELCAVWTPDQWLAFESIRKKPLTMTSERGGARLTDVESGLDKLQTKFSDHCSTTNEQLGKLHSSYEQIIELLKQQVPVKETPTTIQIPSTSTAPQLPEILVVDGGPEGQQIFITEVAAKDQAGAPLSMTEHECPAEDSVETNPCGVRSTEGLLVDKIHSQSREKSGHHDSRDIPAHHTEEGPSSRDDRGRKRERGSREHHQPDHKRSERGHPDLRGQHSRQTDPRGLAEQRDKHTDPRGQHGSRQDPREQTEPRAKHGRREYRERESDEYYSRDSYKTPPPPQLTHYDDREPSPRQTSRGRSHSKARLSRGKNYSASRRYSPRENDHSRTSPASYRSRSPRDTDSSSYNSSREHHDHTNNQDRREREYFSENKASREDDDYNFRRVSSGRPREHSSYRDSRSPSRDSSPQYQTQHRPVANDRGVANNILDARNEQQDRSGAVASDRAVARDSSVHSDKSTATSRGVATDKSTQEGVNMDGSEDRGVADRSNNEEEMDSINYREVMNSIAARFPDDFGEIEQKQRMTSLTESQFEAPILTPTRMPPWSKGFSIARERAQKTLTPENSEKPGIKAGKYLPFPGTLKFYKVQGEQYYLEANQPNSSLAAFKPGNTLKPSFDNAEDLVKTQESAGKRQTLITNSLDWQCAAAANILQELGEHKMSSAAKDKLKLAGRILLSAGKSISQLEQEQVVGLANLRLRRRDAYLKSLGQIPEDVKSKLRVEKVQDTRLFEEEVLQTALTRVREDAKAKSTLKTVQLVDKLSYNKKTEPKKTYTSDFKKPAPKKQTNNYSSQSTSSHSAGRGYQPKGQSRNSSKAPPRAGRGGGHS